MKLSASGRLEPERCRRKIKGGVLILFLSDAAADNKVVTSCLFSSAAQTKTRSAELIRFNLAH